MTAPRPSKQPWLWRFGHIAAKVGRTDETVAANARRGCRNRRSDDPYGGFRNEPDSGAQRHRHNHASSSWDAGPRGTCERVRLRSDQVVPRAHRRKSQSALAGSNVGFNEKTRLTDPRPPERKRPRQRKWSEAGSPRHGRCLARESWLARDRPLFTAFSIRCRRSLQRLHHVRARLVRRCQLSPVGRERSAAISRRPPAPSCGSAPRARAPARHRHRPRGW